MLCFLCCAALHRHLGSGQGAGQRVLHAQEHVQAVVVAALLLGADLAQVEVHAVLAPVADPDDGKHWVQAGGSPLTGFCC